MELTLLNRQRTHALPRRELLGFLERLIHALPPDDADSLALCFVSDRRMRVLNRRFRRSARPTDVLAFPAGRQRGPAAERALGDIVISMDTAVRQAEAARNSLSRELQILVLHGYLHLLGYDHERDQGAMSRIERRLVRRLVRSPRREPSP